MAPRLIARNLPYYQSRNELQIFVPDQRKNLRGLRKEDWFHVMLRWNTFSSVAALLAVWTLFIIVFALFYNVIDLAYPDSDCGLGPLSFGAYFAFSLETCTTVGYGLPGSTNAFFENCPWIQFAIYLQMVWSMMYNAFLFAFFFSRLAKSESRASQVIFSNKAIIRKSSTCEGKWDFVFRVTDVDASHPVVESHVRMFARVGSKLTPMRITNPNDDLGALVMVSWPTEVTHQIDFHSPLHPKTTNKFRLPNGGLLLREVDSVTANREEIICPICSETYGDIDRLRCHVAYNQIVEKHDGIPIEGSHQSLKLEDIKMPSPPSERELLNNFPREIVVLLEGIDPLMSGTFQALQSYTIEDVVLGGDFEDCVDCDVSDDKFVVDLQRFHRIKNHESTTKAILRTSHLKSISEAESSIDSSV